MPVPILNIKNEGQRESALTFNGPNTARNDYENN